MAYFNLTDHELYDEVQEALKDTDIALNNANQMKRFKMMEDLQQRLDENDRKEHLDRIKAKFKVLQAKEAQEKEILRLRESEWMNDKVKYNTGLRDPYSGISVRNPSRFGNLTGEIYDIKESYNYGIDGNTSLKGTIKKESKKTHHIENAVKKLQSIKLPKLSTPKFIKVLFQIT